MKLDRQRITARSIPVYLFLLFFWTGICRNNLLVCCGGGVALCVLRIFRTPCYTRVCTDSKTGDIEIKIENSAMKMPTMTSVNSEDYSRKEKKKKKNRGGEIEVAGRNPGGRVSIFDFILHITSAHTLFTLSIPCTSYGVLLYLVYTPTTEEYRPKRS